MGVTAEPRVSVIIPVRNGGATVISTLGALLRQRYPGSFEVIVIDSESTDGTAARVERLFAEVTTNPAGIGLQVLRIRVRDFGHGRTRNLGARVAKGSLLVFLSHDATPASDYWLQTFLEALADERVAGAFCRQVPRHDARLPERFMLESLYPPQSSLRTAESLRRFSANSILFSNAASALRRTVWERFPFDESLMVCEDQEWGTRVLKAGYHISYVAQAHVAHTHRDTLRRMMSRNFDYALSNRRSAYTKIPAASYLRYLQRELEYVLKNGGVQYVPEMLLVEAARSAGYALGSHGERLPRRVRARLSSYPLWFSNGGCLLSEGNRG